MPRNSTFVASRGRTNWRVVRRASDLPRPTNGAHVLAADTYYELDGQVRTSFPVRYSSGSMIGGQQLNRDQLIIMSSEPAVQANGVSFFIENCSIVAPMGPALDLKADDTTEFFGSFVGVYSTPKLGTIDGYRVPTMKGWNLEGFADGFTFTGRSEKIFIDGSPFRNATGTAKAIHFDADFDCAIVDLTGNYFKDFAAGAVGISQDASATIRDFGLLRGTAFDGLVTPVSGFGPASVEWDFRANAGVRDSRVVAEMGMDGNETATVLTQNTWTKIAGTTATDLVERFSMPQSNRLTYTGRRNVSVVVVAVLTVAGSVNNQAIEVALFKNGEKATPAMGSILTGPVAARADNVAINAILEMGTDDYFEVFVRCTSGSDNATVRSLQVTAQG